MSTVIGGDENYDAAQMQFQDRNSIAG